MKTSAYLLDTAKEHIEGKSSIDEAQKRIQSYYEQRTDRTEVENDTKEADIVSARTCETIRRESIWSSCSGNDECKSSLNYRMCLCDTNLKFGEHGPLWIWVVGSLHRKAAMPLKNVPFANSFSM